MPQSTKVAEAYFFLDTFSFLILWNFSDLVGCGSHHHV